MKRKKIDERHPFFGLSGRAINRCADLGASNRQQLTELLRSTPMWEIMKQRNIGVITYTEMLAWCGLPVPKKILRRTKPYAQCPHCGKQIHCVEKEVGS